MTAPGAGRLADEARKLAEAISTWSRQSAGPTADWARQYAAPAAEWARQYAAPAAGRARDAAGPDADVPSGPRWSDWAHEHPTAGPGTPAECRYCPVCQLIAVLRGERPEAAARVVAAGSALAEALRGVFGPPPDPEPEPPVQHIDVE